MAIIDTIFKTEEEKEEFDEIVKESLISYGQAIDFYMILKAIVGGNQMNALRKIGDLTNEGYKPLNAFNKVSYIRYEV